MTGKCYLTRNKAIAAPVLGGETMIVAASNSTLYTLNDVATVIWESADGATPLDEIVASKICARYDVSPVEALKDAEALVAQLAEHGLLLLSDQPAALQDGSPRGTK